MSRERRAGRNGGIGAVYVGKREVKGRGEWRPLNAYLIPKLAASGRCLTQILAWGIPKCHISILAA